MKWTGWKASVTFFIAGSLLVFVTNLTVLVWAATKTQNTANDGSLILASADTTEACAKQKRLNTWIHLLINILSTIILGGSNYCMQCLSAPTRADINQAHSHGNYLDIGVSSLRNLFYSKSFRTVLWLALGVSSLPLHLFYNSAIYRSTTSNNYAVFSVGPNFVQSGSPGNLSKLNDLGHNMNIPDYFHTLGSPKSVLSTVAARLQGAAVNNQLVRLTPTECINRYIQTFQSEYRNLLLVTDNTTTTINYVEARFYRDFNCNNRQAFSWVCGYAQSQSRGCPTECDQKDMMTRVMADAEAGTWSPMGNRVDHCLAEATQGRCQLQFNMPIAITVVALNFAKIVLMLLVMYFAFRKAQHPILTYGDAANSFLTHPDPTTRFQALLSKAKALKLRDPTLKTYIHNNIDYKDAIWRPVPLKYDPLPGRWGSAVSYRRWFASIILILVALCAAGGYLSTGINALTAPKDLGTLWRMGIGSVSNGSGGGKAIVFSQDQIDLKGAALLFKMVILANIPQLVLSLLYFTYNALFTLMLMASEWASLALKRKGLRVASTHPLGEQRDSYWLQLPFRWSIPLIAFSILLHWLVSQSIFLVNVDLLNYDGNQFPDANNSVGHLLSLGYSPIAIIAVISIGLILVLFVISLAIFRRFSSGMPIVANNSVAISAACHTLSEIPNLASQKLRWGETGQWDESELAQSRGMLHDSDVGLELSHFGFQPNSATPSRAGSTANLLTAEYYREPPQDEVLSGLEDYTLTDSVYWHCGFSSEPVEKPLEGRLYL